MDTAIRLTPADKYAMCARASAAGRWDIDPDVIRGRAFGADEKYLPDGLSLPAAFGDLTGAEQRFVSRIQGRTYANVFGLVERFITAKVLEVGRDHALGDQNALEAVVRFGEEELRHQALFRRIESMLAESMPAGYRFDVDPDEVAAAVLSRSSWAVLLLTLHIELFVQQHYRESIGPDGEQSALFRDVFLFHWRDECQHVVLDELELARHDATLSPAAREQGVEDFIVLVGAVDGILQRQSRSDAAYFARCCGRAVGEAEAARIAAGFLGAYRWQYILSGATQPRFQAILSRLVTPAQGQRIAAAVATLRGVG